MAAPHPDPAPRLLRAVPVLPVRDLLATLAFFERKLGFATDFADTAYAAVVRDGVELHLFACDEPGICEWTSCRVMITGIDAYYEALVAHGGVIHPNGPLVTKPWGLREFTALLPGGAAIAFFEAPAEAPGDRA